MTVLEYSPLPRVEVGPARWGSLRTLRIGGGTDVSEAQDILRALMASCRTFPSRTLVVEALLPDDVRFAIDLINAAELEDSLRVGIVTPGCGYRSFHGRTHHPLTFFHPRQIVELMMWIDSPGPRSDRGPHVLACGIQNADR